MCSRQKHILVELIGQNQMMIDFCCYWLCCYWWSCWSVFWVTLCLPSLKRVSQQKSINHTWFRTTHVRRQRWIRWSDLWTSGDGTVNHSWIRVHFDLLFIVSVELDIQSTLRDIISLWYFCDCGILVTISTESVTEIASLFLIIYHHIDLARCVYCISIPCFCLGWLTVIIETEWSTKPNLPALYLTCRRWLNWI